MIDFLTQGWLVVVGAAMFIGVWSPTAELEYPRAARLFGSLTLFAALVTATR